MIENQNNIKIKDVLIACKNTICVKFNQHIDEINKIMSEVCHMPIDEYIEYYDSKYKHHTENCTSPELKELFDTHSHITLTSTDPAHPCNAVCHGLSPAPCFHPDISCEAVERSLLKYQSMCIYQDSDNIQIDALSKMYKRHLLVLTAYQKISERYDKCMSSEDVQCELVQT